MSFQIVALPISRFDSPLKADDEALVKYGAEWRVVDTCPGFPCRVSLVDAAVGERVLLINVAFHDVNSPYRAAGPIFVRENAKTAKCLPNTIPSLLLHRTLFLRGYDKQSNLIVAIVVEGMQLSEALQKIFSDSGVDYLHIHNAAAGCFICVVHRV